MGKAKVLVVDDEPQVREVLSRYLLSQGYECSTAHDGTSALRAAETEQPHIVLLDISMPGKSGIDVLKELQARYPDTAVVMVTAIADINVAIDAMRNGAYDYLVKPIDLNMLLISVERALERRRLLLENKEYQLHLEKKVEEQTNQIRLTFLGTISALVQALETKDAYTRGHSEIVAEIAVAIAKELGMTEERIEKIRLAALLHDIGRIGVRECVLNKQGTLTAEEYEHVKSHCLLGKRILQPIIDDDEILDIIVHHHERYDGTGYPDGLSAAQLRKETMIVATAEAYATKLSQDAMVVATADAYAAMSSDRPYREALTPQAIENELRSGAGKQFDPAIVDALLRVLQRRSSPSPQPSLGDNPLDSQIGNLAGGK
jgi:putative nucleotidyltransferase with HDIG domain